MVVKAWWNESQMVWIYSKAPHMLANQEAKTQKQR